MTRVLLKISGEAFADRGGERRGIDVDAVSSIAKEICALHKSGVEIGIVMGGGNLFRGLQNGALLGLERSSADSVGMLATVMNGIVLSRALEHLGCKAFILSSFECPSIAEKFRWDLAMRYLKEGIVLFVGGTGHPYFTTDSAAALRASEIKADLLLKGTTRVDAVYDADPLKEKSAKPYKHLSYQEFLAKKLAILDLTAVTLCMTNGIPIRVFNLYSAPLTKALAGEVGTLITHEPSEKQ